MVPFFGRSSTGKIAIIILFFVPLLYKNFHATTQLLRQTTSVSDEEIFLDAINNKQSQESNTAIIITSSWIPSHPSTWMIDKVTDSIKFLVGLPESTPIFITVDGFPEQEYKNLTRLHQKIKDLDGYTTSLFHRHLKNPNVHIITSAENLHIGGSVFKAMTMILGHYPSVEYLYYMQHDFNFFQEVDHLALVDVMEKYPSTVNYVRFKYQLVQNRFLECGNFTEITHPHSPGFSDEINSKMRMMPGRTYSDNNHFVRLQWYFQTIISMVNKRRPPEGPLQKRQNEMCAENKSMGLYFYEPIVLQHLNGREGKGRAN